MKVTPAKSLVAVFAVGAFAFAGCSNGGTTEENADGTHTLRVAMAPGVSSLPVKVAMEKGYFEDAGLKIDLTEGREVSAWQSAAGKQFDIVFTNSAVYAPSLAKGLDNTLINNTTNASDDYVSITLATKDKLSSLSELKGATIATATLTGLTANSLTYLLAQEGVKPGEYELVQMDFGNQLDNVNAGNVDAALTANPYMTTLERGGMVLWGKDLGAEAHKVASNGSVTTASSAMYAANSEWARRNRELINSWLDGVKKGMDFVNNNEDESREILKTWLQLPEELAQDAIIPKYTTEVNVEDDKATWNVLKSNGVLDGEFPEDKFKVYER